VAYVPLRCCRGSASRRDYSPSPDDIGPCARSESLLKQSGEQVKRKEEPRYSPPSMIACGVVNESIIEACQQSTKLTFAT
jgi:hypothetical protein